MKSYWIREDPESDDSVLIGDSKGHRDRPMEGDHVKAEIGIGLHNHKPWNSRSHQLEGAWKDSPLEPLQAVWSC